MPRKKILKDIVPTIHRKSGPKVGSKFPKTVERELRNADINRAIALKADQLVRAGLILALGQTFIYRAEVGARGGQKFVRVTDPDEIAKAFEAIEAGGFDPDGKYYFATAKEPDAQAIDMLLKRAFGMPKQKIGLDDPEAGKIIEIKYMSPEDIKAVRQEVAKQISPQPIPQDAELMVIEQKPDNTTEVTPSITAPVKSSADVSVSIVAPE